MPDEDETSHEATGALSWPDTSRPIIGHAPYGQGPVGMRQPQGIPTMGMPGQRPPHQEPAYHTPDAPPRESRRVWLTVAVFVAGLAIGVGLGAWLL